MQSIFKVLRYQFSICPVIVEFYQFCSLLYVQYSIKANDYERSVIALRCLSSCTPRHDTDGRRRSVSEDLTSDDCIRSIRELFVLFAENLRTVLYHWN